VTDPSQLPHWQESVVSVLWDADTPVAAGSRVVHTRRVGRIERTMTAEVAELNPPRSWAIRGVDGPVSQQRLKKRLEESPGTSPALGS
jgi:hypothetical protein